MIDETLFEAEEKMEKAVSVLREDLGTIRTGRATPQMFAKVVVDYYGAPTAPNGVANINVADARLIVIKPWDRTTIPMIEKAIHQADIGLNPQSDGEVVRLVFPPLTEERRRDLSKVVKNKGEEHKVAIRNIRRDAKEMIDEYVKEGELPEDDGTRATEKVQAQVDAGVKAVDDIVAKKTKDLMEV